MIYRLRRRDGTVAPASSGTLVGADGRARHLARDEVGDRAAREVAEPAQRRPLPGAVAGARPRGRASPSSSRRWSRTRSCGPGRSTGVTYWEGAVAGSGTAGGTPVAVEGYAELTGYAGGMGGLF